ncbi:amidohydrolase [Roseovarius sp. PS-C2]|nr:amidohydrolase [Roseovarius sp. PS-C2]
MFSSVPLKQEAMAWIDARLDCLSADHMTIWNLHEPSWREYKSAAWYVERLRAEGFDVEAGSGGMPTAFCATWSNGDGPTIGGYAEYDAVPGQAQAPVPYRAPREGVSQYAAGHTDPHSALGIGSLTGFLAAKAMMEKHNIPGRLKFMGEPAEKMCGSKPVHAAKGYYDDMDAAISFHPHSFPALTNGCFWDTHSAPYWSRIYTFECDTPETWQQSKANTGIAHTHFSARAPGAIDAVCLMYSAGKYMKESMLPHHGSWTLNEYILKAGHAAADNIAPGLGQIQYSFRGPALSMCEQVFEVLDRNAEHIAAMTHCTLTKAWITRCRSGLPNHAMARLAFANFAEIGPPTWPEEGKAFARQIMQGLGRDPLDEPFVDGHDRLTPPWEAEQAFRAQLPAWQTHIAADDYVEYTWHAPTVRLYVARPTLASPDGYRYGEWTRNAMGGVPACIDPMWSTAGRVISATILDLLTDGTSLAEAQREFRDRSGGGVRGPDWTAPLLPAGFDAPVGYGWPEYVCTARGEGWSHPA